jgi:hypothetical protein
MIRANIKYVLTALICLPVFFINIKTTHDWGDDFAQYIHQAKNIITGVSQKETGYMYNPEFLHLGPPTYPVGFPLLLAPVYAVFGNSTKHFDLYISFFLFAFALLMFYFLNKHFSALISILLVTVFVYNPFTLNFKMEIMSEFPFSFLLLCCVLMYQRIKPFTYVKSIVLALSLGFLISIRNIGMVLVFTMVLDGFINLVRNREKVKRKQFDYKNAVYPVLIAIGGLAIYILLNKVIFDAESNGLFAYPYLFDLGKMEYFIRLNLSNYMSDLRFFFERWNDEWKFVTIFSGSMIFAFIVLGMIKKMTERFDFIDRLLLLYFAMIIIYPFPHAGFRLLLPLVPFLLFYAVEGVKCINIQLRLKPNVLAILMAAILLFSYKKELTGIFDHQKSTLTGPQDGTSREAFNYIIHNTAADARFDFIRARAFALYTDRKCMSHGPNQTSADIDRSIRKYGVSYILINDEISDDSVRTFVKIYEKDWSPMWSNSKYALYRHN